MISKVKKVLSNEGALFTLSNLIFSFSTYLIALIIPYTLDVQLMADFSASLNVVMILAFVFEFGLATSYLRFNQLYQITSYVSAYFQLMILLLLAVIYTTSLGRYIGDFFGLENVSLHVGYLYLAVFAILSWMFFKNIYLSNKKIKTIFINALILLALRVLFLAYIFFQENMPSMDSIFLYLFVIPFSVIIVVNLLHNGQLIFKSLKNFFDYRNIKIFLKRFKNLLVFSAFTYVIGMLYIYTSRYVLVYMTEENMTKELAELGYAFSFGGLIMVFMVSIRLYLISKFNISNLEAIRAYIDKIHAYRNYFILFAIVFALVVSYIVWLIKPDYLSIDAIYYLFMIIFSYALMLYLSLTTLLSKTFDFNKIELVLNVIRLLGVVIAVNLFIKEAPIVGFVIFSAVMVAIEYIFARIVLKKILIKGSSI